MRQISKIHFTPGGEVSNYFNFLKKFETGTERPTKNKPTHMSGFLFILPKRFKKQTLKTEPKSQNC